ncbi:zinc finger protein 667-like [Pygocentrus nattereri]|uniref:C2H2-type domain-containing protein n=1 Tax=Pygocentrus nattereri TaxID=42514 RepID=A0A3B4DPX8_PYGNA|nr:zinc finger protein 667-like [Pygocentrus nattereri]
MTKLDAFNSFLRERLFCVAEEIFHAVQEIVCEQQDELKRAEEEICLLRRELAAASLNNKETDIQASHPGLCTEQQQSQNEPVSSESSLIQVKLELCALQQDAEPQLLSSASTCSSSSSVKSTDVQKKTLCLPPKTKESEGLKMNSYISINLVPCDALLCSENLNSSAVRNQTAKDGCVVGIKEEDVHSCPYCDASFHDFSQLISHMECHKNSLDPLQCQICGKHFNHRMTWKNHMVVHQKIRPFRCKFCSKGFNQKGHLKEHERIHTGEKPFGCSICGKHFTQFNHVRAHIRNHHQNK